MRRLRLGWLLVAIATAAACRPAPTRPTAHPSSAPSATVIRPSGAPPSGPASDGAARTRADFAARARLRPPAGASTLLSGTVRLDPAYAVASGAGNLVANNGGQVLSMANTVLDPGTGGNIVSDAGGGLLSENGIGLVSK